MNIKLYDFNNKWFKDLVYELYKFNCRTPMDWCSNISKYKSLSSKITYLTQKLQEMIDSCEYNFIIIDETIPNNHKVYAFSCYYIRNKKCYNKLIFKSIDYPISKSMFCGNLEMFDRIKNLGFKKLYSVIDRPDEDRYIKFLKRFYNVEINKYPQKQTELIFNLENLLTK